jgi:hypothetical protein
LYDDTRTGSSRLSGEGATHAAATGRKNARDGPFFASHFVSGADAVVRVPPPCCRIPKNSD